MKRKGARNKFNILAFSLMLGGFLLLFESLGFIEGVSRLWPLLALIMGIGFFTLFNHQKEIGFLWLGSFIMMLSIFFLYLNFTSWKQLVKLWPIFIAIFGLSFLSCYLKEKKKMFILVSLFAILLSAAFIIIFNLSVRLWPISLIIAGLFIYVISRYNK